MFIRLTFIFILHFKIWTCTVISGCGKSLSSCIGDWCESCSSSYNSGVTTIPALFSLSLPLNLSGLWSESPEVVWPCMAAETTLEVNLLVAAHFSCYCSWFWKNMFILNTYRIENRKSNTHNFWAEVLHWRWLRSAWVLGCFLQSSCWDFCVLWKRKLLRYTFSAGSLVCELQIELWVMGAQSKRTLKDTETQQEQRTQEADQRFYVLGL